MDKPIHCIHSYIAYIQGQIAAERAREQLAAAATVAEAEPAAPAATAAATVAEGEPAPENEEPDNWLAILRM